MLERNLPLVSVIMSTYNPNLEYLQESVQSILQQTYSNLELIIINDGSEFGLYGFVKKMHDDRIRLYEYKENRKLPKCLNEAIEKAKGIFIARMDDDDIAYPYRLQMQVEQFQKDTCVNVLGSSIDLFGSKEGVLTPNLSPTREEQQADFLLENASIPHPTCMFRKSFLDQYHIRYNEEFYMGAEDYELWTEIVKYTKIDYIGVPLLRYRKHEKQLTRANHSGQYNGGELVRLKQLFSLNIHPDATQRDMHNKLSHIWDIKKSNLKELKEWILLIENKNREICYFDGNALRRKLYQRAATLYFRYLKRNHDIAAVYYVLRFITLQNLRNWMKKI